MRGRPPHGLASSKPRPLLDIGINAPRYHRESGRGDAVRPRSMGSPGAAGNAPDGAQNDSEVPCGSTITEPRAESS